jgi:exodeoxyribonuclease VII large subunit
MDDLSGRAKIYSISELTSEIKQILEDQFSFVWLFGEISNLRIPASGHCYFTLKDETAQIQAVMFRGQMRALKFRPEDGMSVTGLGRITVYEPRGSYQIILEYLEPKGVGALQVAFEQLKRRLEAEGLFDPDRKRDLPYLPENICLITSPTGAVIRDMLQILGRRFPGLRIDVVPVKVQGAGAVEDIVSAIDWVNALGRSDVAVLARGGGSLEDLQAFNSEAVARAVFASQIPIVSAVGHETDFTIADFVADLRAPTPSAAAELLVPIKNDLYEKIYELRRVILYLLNQNIKNWRTRIAHLSQRLVDPRKKMADLRLRLDDLGSRLERAGRLQCERSRDKLSRINDKLLLYNPIGYILSSKSLLEYQVRRLNQSVLTILRDRRALLRENASALSALNPTGILARGYSITRSLPDGVILRDSAGVAVNQDVEVKLFKGALTCRVKEKHTDG